MLKCWVNVHKAAGWGDFVLEMNSIFFLGKYVYLEPK